MNRQCVRVRQFSNIFQFLNINNIIHITLRYIFIRTRINAVRMCTRIIIIIIIRRLRLRRRRR